MPPARFIILLAILLGPTAFLGQEPTESSSSKYDGQPAEVWLARLKETDDTLRIRAAYALGRISPPSRETVAALIKGVDDRAQEVRWYSADSLGRFGPAAKEAVPVLLAGVKDPANDKPFQRTAAQAFGRIGSGAEEAVPWLVEALKDPDAPLRVTAALALWRIKKHPNSLATLTEALADSSGEGSYLASMALLELGEDARPAAPALVAALGNPSADARRAAARVLGKLGREMIKPLADALDDSAKREGALAALAMLIEEARVAALYNPRASNEAFTTAQQDCVETLLPALIRLFADSNQSVRSAASLAAAKMGIAGVPALVAALGDENEEAKAAAIMALTRLEEYLPGGAQSAHLAQLQKKLPTSLIVALRNKEPAVRSAALRLFAELTWGPEAQPALPLLREALKSEDPLVRRNAAKALEQVQKGAARP
jgi:HEAT repeat protein